MNTDSESLFNEPIRKDPPILGFFGEYRFLSNFHLCYCVFDGIIFPSSEHVYMFQKSFDPAYRVNIFRAATPKIARQLGQSCKLIPAWNDYRKTAMLYALQSKFKNEKEWEMLKSTGDAYLEETNTWGDRYWGVCGGVGQNNLGKLLMKIRDTL